MTTSTMANMTITVYEYEKLRSAAEIVRVENADLRRLIQAERDVNTHMQILIDELREALEKVEFVEETRGDFSEYRCPWCHGYAMSFHPHAPDCQRQHVLGKSA